MESILNVQNLSIDYIEKNQSAAVQGVSFELYPGEILAIIGETGSGKTSFGRALLNINPTNAETTFDQIVTQFDEEKILTESGQLDQFRGGQIAMLFQEPASYLNPMMRCGRQIIEALLLEAKLSKNEAKQKALELLSDIGFDDADRIYNSYPSQLSGGESQRVMLASAMAREPRIIVADEPSSSLDVVSKNAIFNQFQKLVTQGRKSVILITHDLELAAKHADRILVMREGQVVDEYTTETFKTSEYIRFHYEKFNKKGNAAKDEENRSNAFLSVRNLSVWHEASGGKSLFFNTKKQGLSDVSFSLKKGEILGIQGVSGSGKTTLVRCIAGINEAQSGELIFHENQQKGSIQMVFQHPGLALSPKMKIDRAMSEILKCNKKKYSDFDLAELSKKYFSMVRLDAEHLSKTPDKLSGGQKQRACIAMALATKPSLLLFDEAVSSLDLAHKLEILDLILELRNKLNLTVIFISHEHSVVKFVADRILTMSEGRLNE